MKRNGRRSEGEERRKKLWVDNEARGLKGGIKDVAGLSCQEPVKVRNVKPIECKGVSNLK